MRELIDDLLDVARIETGALPVSPEPTEVALLVDRARNIFLSGGGRSSLDIDLAPRLPAVMADRRRIVQVIGNLLSNAARHSPAATAIKLGAFREGGHVVMFVADEGRGIPSEQLPRLFRKFSETGAREQAGDTGLGLVISRGIVAAHGGRIWARERRAQPRRAVQLHPARGGRGDAGGPRVRRERAAGNGRESWRRRPHPGG